MYPVQDSTEQCCFMGVLVGRTQGSMGEILEGFLEEMGFELSIESVILDGKEYDF